jgi:glycerol-3-phosphate O-acyltransferase/dihydroxyacetone phosphate acyltransferase
MVDSTVRGNSNGIDPIQRNSNASGNDAMKKHYEKLRKLYKPASTVRLFIYDLILWGFCVIFDCFFREIRSRGGFKVPKNDSIIFVAAPHANQFVDPIILMSQVKKASGRRVSCLIAEKSHRRKFIGLVSRSQLSIPVKRAQDNLKIKTGTITLDPKNELHIIGKNTFFLKDCQKKGMIALPRSLGTSIIDSVVSDTELYLRKPIKFSSDTAEIEGKKLLEIGTTFKAADSIDQSEVYAQVFEHLAHGNCIGVFSEGGSHDRPDLLPLKAGVALMALGAMDSTPGLNVKIVPVGMNYFHAHKFRSRALLEFGDPIEISESLVNMYNNSETTSEAVKILLNEITKGVKAVTVSCPDFSSISVVQAARRLYSNNFSSKLSIASVVEMNRRLLHGYLHYKNEPKIEKLKNDILKYNEDLKSMRIPDHLVGNTPIKSKLSILGELFQTSSQILILTILALPGIILFSPVFIATKKISEKKRKEALAGSTVKIRGNDVIATWKILVSMGFAPILYTIYSLVGIKIVHLYYPATSKLFAFSIFYLVSVLVTYSALIFGDKGMDLYKENRASWLMLTNKQRFEDLKVQRDKLSSEITDAINEFGPQLYPDFNLLEYEKKLELKKLLQSERKKRHLTIFDSGLTEEEQLEELKTQELRRRRIQKKALKKESESNIDKKFKMTQDTPILNGDDISSSNELSTTSMSDVESTSSDSEYNNSSSDKFKTLDTIRNQIIKENREREREEFN